MLFIPGLLVLYSKSLLAPNVWMPPILLSLSVSSTSKCISKGDHEAFFNAFFLAVSLRCLALDDDNGMFWSILVVRFFVLLPRQSLMNTFWTHSCPIPHVSEIISAQDIDGARVCIWWGLLRARLLHKGLSCLSCSGTLNTSNSWDLWHRCDGMLQSQRANGLAGLIWQDKATPTATAEDRHAHDLADLALWTLSRPVTRVEQRILYS